MNMSIIKIIYALSIATHLILLLTIFRLKQKKQVHLFCFLTILLTLIWVIPQMLSNIFNFNFWGFAIYIQSFSTLFSPSTLLILSFLIIKEKLKRTLDYFKIFLPSIIFSLIYFTNDIHKLVIVKRIGNTTVAGPFFYIIYIWQILYITIAVFYSIYYSYKYTGYVSKQILFFVIGILIPIASEYISFIFYLSCGYKISTLPAYMYSLTYSIASICITISVYKYKFMDKVPISNKSILEHISDSFLVLDFKNNVVNMNQVFKDNFGNFISVQENSLFEVLSDKLFNNFKEQIIKNISLASSNNKTIYFECALEMNPTSYYNVGITPILIHKRFMGTLIFLKDISLQKQVSELQKENTLRLIEKERLISLNQLIGGIAHNLKSPLMASSGGIFILENNTKKIEELLKSQDTYLSSDQYKSIIDDMNKWETKIKQYLVYMSDVVSAVRDQTINMNSNKNISFSVEKLLEQITILLEFELKKTNCILNKIIKINPNTLIDGDITVLTQILNNLIINAIQSYNDGGCIDLTIDETLQKINFTIEDHGKGISKQVMDKIFTEMITTKGTNGSGLGLYLANIAIKGQFNGSINIESELDKGTKVVILFPIKRDNSTN